MRLRTMGIGAVPAITGSGVIAALKRDVTVAW